VSRFIAEALADGLGVISLFLIGRDFSGRLVRQGLRLRHGCRALSSDPMRSPAHSFVPRTVPTSLQPIGSFGNRDIRLRTEAPPAMAKASESWTGGACLGTREPRCSNRRAEQTISAAPTAPQSREGYAAGDARGFPFSTTYVIRMMHLASAGLPPAWGVSGGIWKASPFLIARVG
jgi:hypothetical protein